MTCRLLADKVGDQGQQYEVRAKGWPEEGWNVIGWASTLEGGRQLAEAIFMRPQCEETEVHDRWA